MRFLFHWATLSTAIALSTAATAADSYFSATTDANTIINSNDDDVVLASCNNLSSCNDNCSDGCNSGSGLTCRNTPMRFKSGACGCGDWLSNTVAFSGAEAFKSIGDTSLPPGGATGYMNSAGFVNGLNTGFRIGGSKIRGQVGGSFGVYDLKGRDTTSPRQPENQGFLTTGVFKRSNIDAAERLAWGLVYDQLWDHQYGVSASDIYVGQFRGILGLALDPCNEVGFWGTAHTNSSPLTGFSFGQSVQAIDQYNLFWNHNYAFGGRSMLYAGLTDHSSIGSWTTGTQLIAPMSQRVSLYGNSAFLFPSSTRGLIGSNELLWSVSAGLSYSFGCKAVSRNISGQCGLPLQQVANNGTFMMGNKTTTLIPN